MGAPREPPATIPPVRLLASYTQSSRAKFTAGLVNKAQPRSDGWRNCVPTHRTMRPGESEVWNSRATACNAQEACNGRRRVASAHFRRRIRVPRGVGRGVCNVELPRKSLLSNSINNPRHVVPKTNVFGTRPRAVEIDVSPAGPLFSSSWIS